MIIQKIKHFLKRDKDITYYDEFHYIWICFRETVNIIINKNKKLYSYRQRRNNLT